MLSRHVLSSASGESLPIFISSSINRTASTATNTVTAPSSIQDGDLLVAVGIMTNNAQLTITPPSGFNVISNDITADNSFFIATKTAASESGNYTFTWSASGANNTIAILVYRKATRVNTVGASTRTNGSTTTTAPSITPTFKGTLCSVFAVETTATVSTPPSGMTQRAVQTANSPSFAVYDLSNQAAAATSAYTLIWSAAGDNIGIQFQVTNESTVAPEFVASANTQNPSSSGTLVINKPTGTIENDLMVAVMATSGGSLPWTGDTGWTEVADLGSAPNLRIAYKVAGASEGSSYTFTNAGGRINSGTILTYRYASYDTIAGSFTTGTDPLVLTSISPSLSQSLLIAAGAVTSAPTTLGTPGTMTARFTDNDGTQPSFIVCDQSVAKGPAGTRSISTGTINNVAGIMLSIKPTRSL